MSKEEENILKQLKNDLEQAERTVGKEIGDIQKETGLKKGEILHPIRIALTGEGSGPSLKYIVALLGKKIVLERINALRS